MTVTTLAKPDTDFRCKHCDRPMWRRGTPLEDRAPGSISHSGRGACTACYHRIYTLGGHTVREAKPATKRDEITLPPPVDTSWHEEGACRDADDTLFYHPAGERGAMRRKRAELAKAICRTCPVMAICRQDALKRREAFGTWGGMSEDERAAVLAGRRVAS